MADGCEDFLITVNQTLSVSYLSLLRKGVREFPGAVNTYLRSDMQALMPWIITLVIIIEHVPTIFLRMQRWEDVQAWCLACTFLTVVTYILAYVSTSFSPESILVWTPLLLVIDAGSMAQVFFLVCYEYSLFVPPRVLWIKFRNKILGKRTTREG